MIIYFSLKNVDAGAAKELMASLVKLQSSLSEVNQYVSYAALKLYSCIRYVNSSVLFLFVISQTLFLFDIFF